MDTSKVSQSSGARAQDGPPGTPAQARPGRLVPAESAREGAGSAGRTSSGLEAITVTTAEDRVTYRREVNAQFIRPDTDGLHVWKLNWDHVLYPWGDVLAFDKPEEPISPRDPRIADHVKDIGRGHR